MMLRKLSMSFAAASVSALLAGSPAALAATPQDEVMEVEHGIAAATNADQLTPYYAPDVVVYDMLVPGEFHGWPAAHDNFAAQFAQVRHPKVEIIDLTVVAGDTIAYAYSTQRFSFDLPDGGAHAQVIFRQTDGLKKINGKWKVTHQQLSVPYDPATGKAVLAPPAQ
jgi:ketosteroid isomerase-like protein